MENNSSNSLLKKYFKFLVSILFSIIVLVAIVVFIGSTKGGGDFWKNNGFLLAISCVGTLMVAIASLSTTLLNREQFIANRTQKKQEIKPIISPVSSKITFLIDKSDSESPVKWKYYNENVEKKLGDGIQLKIYNLGKAPAKNINLKIKINNDYFSEINSEIGVPAIFNYIQKENLGAISMNYDLKNKNQKTRNITTKKYEKEHFDVLFDGSKDFQFITIPYYIIEPLTFLTLYVNPPYAKKPPIVTHLTFEDIDGTPYEETYSIFMNVSEDVYDENNRKCVDVTFTVKNRL